MVARAEYKAAHDSRAATSSADCQAGCSWACRDPHRSQRRRAPTPPSHTALHVCTPKGRLRNAMHHQTNSRPAVTQRCSYKWAPFCRTCKYTSRKPIPQPAIITPRCCHTPEACSYQVQPAVLCVMRAEPSPQALMMQARQHSDFIACSPAVPRLPFSSHPLPPPPPAASTSCRVRAMCTHLPTRLAGPRAKTALVLRQISPRHGVVLPTW